MIDQPFTNPVTHEC